VHHQCQLAQRHTNLLQRAKNAECLVLGSGRNLGQPNFAADRVECDQVGKGTADVNACDPAHGDGS